MKSNLDVHTRHCCRVHGCKYGDSDCPVWLCYKVQESACYYCWDEAETFEYPLNIDKIPKIRSPEILKRRKEDDEKNLMFFYGS